MTIRACTAKSGPACWARAPELQHLVTGFNNESNHKELTACTAMCIRCDLQATGLALPGADLDIVVLGSHPELQNPAMGFSLDARFAISGLLEVSVAIVCNYGTNAFCAASPASALVGIAWRFLEEAPQMPGTCPRLATLSQPPPSKQ